MHENPRKDYHSNSNFTLIFNLIYLKRSRLEYTAKGCPLDAEYVEIKDLRKAEFYPTACV